MLCLQKPEFEDCPSLNISLAILALQRAMSTNNLAQLPTCLPVAYSDSSTCLLHQLQRPCTSTTTQECSGQESVNLKPKRRDICKALSSCSNSLCQQVSRLQLANGCTILQLPALRAHDLASLGMWLVMGTLRDLAANRTFLKRERSEPLGRAKPKLMSEMAFSHSVSPSGPFPVDSLSALCLFSLDRCPLVVLRFCVHTPQHESAARHRYSETSILASPV